MSCVKASLPHASYHVSARREPHPTKVSIARIDTFETSAFRFTALIEPLADLKAGSSIYRDSSNLRDMTQTQGQTPGAFTNTGNINQSDCSFWLAVNCKIGSRQESVHLESTSPD